MPVILGRAIRLSFGPGCLGRASYACDLTHSRCQLLWHGSPGFPNSVRSPGSGRGGKAVEPVASGDDNARPPELGEAMADRPFRHAQPGVKR